MGCDFVFSVELVFGSGKPQILMMHAVDSVIDRLLFLSTIKLVISHYNIMRRHTSEYIEPISLGMIVDVLFEHQAIIDLYFAVGSHSLASMVQDLLTGYQLKASADAQERLAVLHESVKKFAFEFIFFVIAPEGCPVVLTIIDRVDVYTTRQ